jgi:hypothetical protein
MPHLQVQILGAMAVENINTLRTAEYLQFLGIMDSIPPRAILSFLG